MNIIYISQHFDDENYMKLFTKDKKPMHAANKYHSLLIKGLALNGMSVSTYSVLPVTTKNCDKRIIHEKSKKENNLTINYISFLNFRFIRRIQLFFNTLFKILFAKSDTVVIYDALNVSTSFGTLIATKIRRLISLAIITDLPELLNNDKKNGRIVKINNRLLGMPDGYIFVTEQMNIVVNKNDKPYIVLEGLVDINMKRKEHIPIYNTKKIMYAGTLKSIYGIQFLCEAFVRCCKEDEELHIYGDGDYANKLRQLEIENENIYYHGNCLNEEVVKAELEAVLLVNPRPTSGEYTKYSFPSKTLEYMVSGTPVLSSRLPGIPKEYDSFLYYFDDKTSLGLEVAIRCILDENVDEIMLKGKAARDFVLKEKNNVAQAKRIIDFIYYVSENYSVN